MEGGYTYSSGLDRSGESPNQLLGTPAFMGSSSAPLFADVLQILPSSQAASRRKASIRQSRRRPGSVQVSVQSVPTPPLPFSDLGRSSVSTTVSRGPSSPPERKLAVSHFGDDRVKLERVMDCDIDETQDSLPPLNVTTFDEGNDVIAKCPSSPSMMQRFLTTTRDRTASITSRIRERAASISSVRSQYLVEEPPSGPATRRPTATRGQLRTMMKSSSSQEMQATNEMLGRSTGSEPAENWRWKSKRASRASCRHRLSVATPVSAMTMTTQVQLDVVNSLAQIDSLVRTTSEEDRKPLPQLERRLSSSSAVDEFDELSSFHPMARQQMSGTSTTSKLQAQWSKVSNTSRISAVTKLPAGVIVHKISSTFPTLVHSVTNTQKLRWTLDLWKAHMIDIFSSLTYRLSIWNSRLKSIEGKFGTGVVSYFVFLRSLLWLNILLLMPMLCFMMIPQWTEPVPDWHNTTRERAWFDHFGDTVTGQGYLTKSPFFYSGYTDGRIGGSYKMPEAFFYTTAAVMVMSFVIVAARTYTSYKLTLSRDKDNFYSYTSKIFGGWDYSISNEDSARVKSISIHQHILEELLYEKALGRVLTTEEKVQAISRRVVVNFIVFALLGLAGASIYFVSAFSIKAVQQIQSNGGKASVSLYIQKLAVTLTISSYDICSPVLFGKLAEYELWLTPREEVKYTLYRTIVLKLSSLIVLMVTIFIRISSCEPDSQLASCLCWESVAAQELWQLSIVSFFAAALGVVLGQLVWKILWKRYKIIDKTLGPPEFQIAKYILELVYMQAMVWLGYYFSPGLPVIVIIQLFLLFYLQLYSLFFNLKPSHRPYRAGSNNAFQLLMLATLMTCLFPLGYAFVTFTPSSQCGPFRGLTSTFGVTQNLTKDAPGWFVSFLSVVFSSIFLVPLFIVFLLVVIFSFARQKGQHERAQVLKEHLIVEGKDKQFLIAKVTSQQGVIQGLVTRLMSAQERLGVHYDESQPLSDIPDVDKMLDELSIDTVSASSNHIWNDSASTENSV